jgi:hypothetical protein
LSDPERKLDPIGPRAYTVLLEVCLTWHPDDRATAADLASVLNDPDPYGPGTNDADIDSVEMNGRDELRRAGKWDHILKPRQEVKYEKLLLQHLHRRDLDEIHDLDPDRRRAKKTKRGPPPETSFERSRLLARIDDDLFELHDTTYRVTCPKAVPDDVEDPVSDSVKTTPCSRAQPSPSTQFEPSRYSETWKYINLHGYKRDLYSTRCFRPLTGTTFCASTGVGKYGFVRKLNHGNNSNIWLLSHNSVAK